MAFINLNLYEEITVKDFIKYVKSRHSQCDLMSNKELLDYLDENIYSLVIEYLENLDVDYGDIEWESGVDELWYEIVAYLDA